MTTFLSKSRILSGVQCPKRLYLEVHHPELAEGEEGGFAVGLGHEVTAAARGLFPDGHLVPWDDGLSSALRDTARHLAEQPRRPLFEGTFSHDNVLVRTDILRRGPRSRRWTLTEVKASASVKDYYLIDCAVQAWVVEGSGCPLDKVELAHIDTSFVYPGGGDYRGLFHHEDMTDQVREEMHRVPALVQGLRAVLQGAEPDIAVGPQCNDPFACPFQDYCDPPAQRPAFPVSCLPNRSREKDRLLAEGVRDVREIPDGVLTKPLQERVRRVTVAGVPEVDPALGEILRTLVYPRYYLDFETVLMAVPLWAGTRPYEQLPFQWSCHVEPAPGQFEHREFLHTAEGAPMGAFVDALLAALGDAGPILVYTGFEKGRLLELAARFPARRREIESVIARLVDLHAWVKAYYYHPDMLGSWSIKNVLPTVAAHLSYDDLGEVRDGMAAVQAYLEMIHPDTDTARRSQLASDLLRYCERDTLAMVELVRKFSATQ